MWPRRLRKAEMRCSVRSSAGAVVGVELADAGHDVLDIAAHDLALGQGDLAVDEAGRRHAAKVEDDLQELVVPVHLRQAVDQIHRENPQQGLEVVGDSSLGHKATSAASSELPAASHQPPVSGLQFRVSILQSNPNPHSPIPSPFAPRSLTADHCPPTTGHFPIRAIGAVGSAWRSSAGRLTRSAARSTAASRRTITAWSAQASKPKRVNGPLIHP